MLSPPFPTHPPTFYTLIWHPSCPIDPSSSVVVRLGPSTTPGTPRAALTNQRSRGHAEDWFTAWPGDALVAVAEMFLASVEFDSDDTRRAIVESCQRFHEDTRVLSAEFLAKLKRQNYVTPTR